MSQLKYVRRLNFKKNGIVLFESKFKTQSRITRKVDMLEPFRLRILSSHVILKRNQWWKNFESQNYTVSMAGSSDHNSAKPRPRARSPIYLCSTSHKESEYVVKSQKTFPIFSLVIPTNDSFMFSRSNGR
jgi:hypothetical protein